MRADVKKDDVEKVDLVPDGSAFARIDPRDRWRYQAMRETVLPEVEIARCQAFSVTISADEMGCEIRGLTPHARDHFGRNFAVLCAYVPTFALKLHRDGDECWLGAIFLSQEEADKFSQALRIVGEAEL